MCVCILVLVCLQIPLSACCLPGLIGVSVVWRVGRACKHVRECWSLILQGALRSWSRQRSACCQSAVSTWSTKPYYKLEYFSFTVLLLFCYCYFWRFLLFSSFCSSFQPLTAWSRSGPSGRSATSPVVKDTPFEPVWLNWSRSLGAVLVPRPSRGRNARSGSAGQKWRRREEVQEEEREVDEVNREEMQRQRSSQVGGNNLLYCQYY